MTSELAIFVSGLSTLILAAVFSVMAYLYFKLAGKYFSLKTTKDLAKLRESEAEEARKRAQKVFEEADIKAKEIIEQATRKAQSLISEAEVFSGQEKQKMDAFLQNVTLRQGDSFQKVLLQFADNSNKLMENISQSIQESTEKELLYFRTSLQQESAKFGESVVGAVEAERKKTEDSLKVYKQKMMKKIDEKIFEIIKVASKEILGKTLTADEHTELVIKALEEAKKENVF